MKVKTLQRLATVVGFALFIVSTVFTVKLLVTFGNNGSEKLVYAVFGIAIQSCQTLLFIFSLALIWSNKPGWSLPGFILFGLLFVLSLCGTIGFFAVGNKAKIQGSYDGDLKYNQMKSRIDMIDKEIAANQQIMSDYAAKGIVTKGVKPTQERLDRLISDRESAYAGLMAYTPSPASDALYERIAGFFGTDTERAKTAIFAFYALALDLSAVFLLGYGFGCQKWFNQDSDITGADETHFQAVQNDSVQKSKDFPIKSIQDIQNNRKFIIPEKDYYEFMNTVQQLKQQNHSDFQDKNYENFIEYAVQHLKPSVQNDSVQNLNHSVQKSDDSVQKSMQAVQKISVQNDAVQNDSVQKSKPSVQTDSVQNFKPSVQHDIALTANGYADDDVIAALPDYIRWLYKARKHDGSLAGRKLIADKTGITNRVATKCHEYLKSRGFVRVEGIKTFSDMTYDEMLDALNINPLKSKVA